MAARDLIAEFKALRLHGMAATWAELRTCERTPPLNR